MSSKALTPAQRILASANKRPRRKLSPVELAERRANAVKLPNAVVEQCQQIRLPPPVREYRIPGDRKYLFDLAWPEALLLVECQGGTWQKQRTGHSTGTGIERDADKLNYASVRGWRVLHVTTAMIESGKAIHYIRLAIRGLGDGD